MSNDQYTQRHGLDASLPGRACFLSFRFFFSLLSFLLFWSFSILIYLRRPCGPPWGPGPLSEMNLTVLWSTLRLDADICFQFIRSSFLDFRWPPCSNRSPVSLLQSLVIFYKAIIRLHLRIDLVSASYQWLAKSTILVLSIDCTLEIKLGGITYIRIFWAVWHTSQNLRCVT